MPAHLLALQRTVGNRDVQRMLARRNDGDEQGANQVGEMGMRMAEAPAINESPSGKHYATAQLKATGRPIQARAAQGLIQRQEKKKKTSYVPYQIHVKQPMTQEEFRVAAMRQIFGGVLQNVEWRYSKDSYVPENSPYRVEVDTQLLKQQRGQASKERGISMGGDDGVTGAEERAKTFHAGSESDEKSALMKEIDRRYFEAVGDQTETKIKTDEKGKAELWRMIRDEVLFQHEYIANLPPNVKLLIKQSITGKVLTPADYDQLFRIAKKIEAMPPGQATDYASKVTGTTTDLNQFEASLESYSTAMAKRQKGTEAHKDTITKLAGLEQVYEKYKTWVTNEIIAPGANQTEQAELEKQLKAHDFAGIPEFKQYIDKFLMGFETESAGIIQDLLAKYDGRLYREGERYKNPQEVSALHGKLGGYRSNLDVMKQSEDVMQAEYAKQRDARERSRLPGHGGTTPEPTEAFKAAQKKGEGAREAAKGELRNLAPEHPIFQDDEALPVDRRINKIALRTATETSLQGLLLGFIAQRKDAVKDARGELAGNSELIWKMDKMIPQFMLQQGIVDGSIHAQIIQDKMGEDRIKKIVMGILAAIAAIALTVVSLGTATPAIVAAGAAAGAFSLSAYMAYEDVKNYAQDKKLADVGLVDDPSIIWVVVAIAGAALDAAAAVKAIRAISPLARAVNTGGDLVTFNKAVRALEEVGEIDAKIARAAERAAAAKASFKEASTDLVQILGNRMSMNPFTDPDVYTQLVKMAAAKFKEVGNNGLIFIEEIKRARALAKLGEMTPKELAKVKQAWAEGKQLVDDALKELAPTAERITELKNALKQSLPVADDLTGPTLVMLNKLDKTVLPKLRSASASELEKLGKMLVEDPTLGERLAKAMNPLGALKKSTTLLDMDNALFTNRLTELKVNAYRIGPAVKKSGLSPNELAKLTDADLKALGEGDRLLAAARQGKGPSDIDAAGMAKAAAEFDKISGVSKAARDELRASVSHSHNISDLPFMKNPAEALSSKFPSIPKAKMDVLTARHPDALRALESASEVEVQRVIKALEESANPKDVEDILRSYMYKAQKRARKLVGSGGTEGLNVPDSVGERVGESIDNLAKARAQGHPFGFANKAQYEQFISTVDKEVAARGIKGQAKVQGSAMHSKAPGDIDMEIVVDQVEFDRLAKDFVKNAPNAKAAAAVKASIAKKKIPSYEFFPDDSPSVASAAKKFTQGADGKELEVQATLIVKGSEFDLGPFL